jgi:hypothetical protein
MQIDPHIPASPTEEFTFVFTGSVSTEPVTVHNVSYGEVYLHHPPRPLAESISFKPSFTFQSTPQVYLCSGQSNMVVPNSYAYNFTELAEKLPQFANMRFFRTPLVKASTPQEDTNATWKYFDSTAVLGSFPAVCFLSVLEVMQQRGRAPNQQGAWNGTYAMVHAAVGGTCVESWMPAETLSSAYATCATEHPVGGGAGPSELYNGMVAPLVSWSVRAILWDQGECNTHYDTEADYVCLFNAMIRSWRQLWNEGDTPFVYVQIGAYEDQGNVSTIRLAENDVLPAPNHTVVTTGMAATYDLGSPCPGSPVGTWCIHCRNKTEVGRRLGRQVGWKGRTESGTGCALLQRPSSTYLDTTIIILRHIIHIFQGSPHSVQLGGLSHHQLLHGLCRRHGAGAKPRARGIKGREHCL